MILKEDCRSVFEADQRDGRAGRALDSSPWTEPLMPVPSVREALAQHLDKILILPSGRRIPVEALLDHLDTGPADASHYEWRGFACEVGFEERLDPSAADAPWSAPDAEPCWQGQEGPLFHLWVTEEPRPRRLFGLIIPDQRGAPPLTEVVQLSGPGERAGNQPDPPVPGLFMEVQLTDVVVESAAYPSLPATDPRLIAVWRPEGGGWQGRWWKLGPEGRWQYGWWRGRYGE